MNTRDATKGDPSAYLVTYLDIYDGYHSQKEVMA